MSESLTNLSEEAKEKHGEERIAVRNDYYLAERHRSIYVRFEDPAN